MSADVSPRVTATIDALQRTVTVLQQQMLTYRAITQAALQALRESADECERLETAYVTQIELGRRLRTRLAALEPKAA